MTGTDQTRPMSVMTRRVMATLSGGGGVAMRRRILFAKEVAETHQAQVRMRTEYAQSHKLLRQINKIVIIDHTIKHKSSQSPMRHYNNAKSGSSNAARHVLSFSATTRRSMIESQTREVNGWECKHQPRFAKLLMSWMIAADDALHFFSLTSFSAR